MNEMIQFENHWLLSQQYTFTGDCEIYLSLRLIATEVLVILWVHHYEIVNILLSFLIFSLILVILHLDIPNIDKKLKLCVLALIWCQVWKR